MWRRKNSNPPSPPNDALLPYQIADPADADVEALRWKIHSYIDGMGEYMLRLVWSFLMVYYPNDPDSHCRR